MVVVSVVVVVGLIVVVPVSVAEVVVVVLVVVVAVVSVSLVSAEVSLACRLYLSSSFILVSVSSLLSPVPPSDSRSPPSCKLSGPRQVVKLLIVKNHFTTS
jgi:hypothetical protein